MIASEFSNFIFDVFDSSISVSRNEWQWYSHSSRRKADRNVTREINNSQRNRSDNGRRPSSVGSRLEFPMFVCVFQNVL